MFSSFLVLFYLEKDDQPDGKIQRNGFLNRLLPIKHEMTLFTNITEWILISIQCLQGNHEDICKMCTFLRHSIAFCDLSKKHFGEPSWQHEKCHADFKHKKHKEKEKSGDSI